MSLLTRCPRCAAVYQVSDAQLQVSAGWVRCGQCAEIFEAAASPLDPIDMVQPLALSVPDQDAGAWTAAAASPETPATPGLTGSEQESVTVPDVAPAVEPLLRKESAPEPWVQTAAQAEYPTRAAARQAAPPQAAFLQTPVRNSRWDQPWVRRALLATCVLLAMTALLQWLHGDRDRLASARPELKPYLQLLCQPLNCRVAALRSVDALVIDASAFVLAGQDSYRLSFVLKNQSRLAVAVPHIELTLTDSLDHAVLRRVLTPQELGSTAEALGAGEQWPVSLAFGLEQEQGRVLGYRLLAFYP